MTLQEILEAPYSFQDANAKSIRQYFKALLETLWMEGEGFSGKRPFGNSGWEYDIYTALVAMRAVGGTLDSEGYLDTFDRESANKLVYRLIDEVFK